MFSESKTWWSLVHPKNRLFRLCRDKKRAVMLKNTRSSSGTTRDSTGSTSGTTINICDLNNINYNNMFMVYKQYTVESVLSVIVFTRNVTVILYIPRSVVSSICRRTCVINLEHIDCVYRRFTQVYTGMCSLFVRVCARAVRITATYSVLLFKHRSYTSRQYYLYVKHNHCPRKYI